ncbi:MAG: DNA-3-methyladenine glycosylase [Nitrososphaerales archaeon]
MSTALDASFYSRSPLIVARDLIGKEIVRRLDKYGITLRGLIVETEAYGGSGDPASHACRGATRRNAVMFGEPGRAYIYFTYGNHFCLNFVTGKFRSDKAGAVLIRALEPTSGFEVMQKLRQTEEQLNLTSGPGKLCRALGIDLGLSGLDVTSAKSEIHVRENNTWSGSYQRSPRIGIRKAKEKKWRFFASNNPYVSRKLIYPRIK